LRARSPSATVVYSVSQKSAYRSENEGVSWDNLTGFRGRSILGDGLSDLAVSPSDASVDEMHPGDLKTAEAFGANFAEVMKRVSSAITS